MVSPPWRAPWSDLRLEDLREFFSEVAGAESLTWEAKGDRPHPDSIRKHVCGFANQLGGYLILGVAQAGSGWDVCGTEFPHEEPSTWLLQVAGAGMAPAPFVDAKHWETDDGRFVAVLCVDPVQVPPCLLDGTVFQRVAGATTPVKDQAVLLELIQRGAAAREKAYAKATRWAAELANPGGSPRLAEDPFRIAVAVSPVAHEPDTPRRVFRRGFMEHVTETLRALEDMPPSYVSNRSEASHRPEFLDVRLRSELGGIDTAWTCRCWGDGTVALSVALSEYPLLTNEAAGDRWLGRTWETAASLCQELGGRGPSYAAIATFGETKRSATLASTREPFVRKMEDLAGPRPEDIAGVGRDLHRLNGVLVWEAEEDAGDPAAAG
jgi:hypothetical protein